ncbi:MAG: VWA domain-containing protein [Candidatus Acidiferrum sp.]
MTLATPSHRLDLFHCCYPLATFLLLFSLPAYSQTSQQPPPSPGDSDTSVISVTTELVALPVRVTDSHGNFVTGLKQPDFQVYQDGQQQKITLFQQEDTPVTVGLVVDHSRSMGSKLPEVASAVSAFAHSSNPQDEMFVVDFNDDVSPEMLGGKPFTSDPNVLSNAVAAVSARGRTALYDAVAEGMTHLELGHWDKKALVIVSDGGDNASHLKFSQLLDMAQRSRVAIYSVVLVGSNEEENPGILRRLCKSTGGIAYFPGRGETVAGIMALIARDLREQYTLGFVPQKQGNAASFHKLQVKVSAPGRGKLHVRSRPGYYSAPGHSFPEKRKAPAQTGVGAT